MLAAGEPLGKRYVVARAPEDNRAGTLLDLVDHGAAVIHAQILAESPMQPTVMAALRPVLSAVPASAALLRPREIVFTRESIPLSLFDRSGLAPLRDRVKELAVARGPLDTVTTLLGWVATIARELGRVHTAQVSHGAVTARVMLCNATGPVESCVLSGFGIGPLAAQGDTAKVLTPRQDLVDLIASLQELFVVGGVAPEGSLAAKWMLLRHSSQHGEHPALSSGAALAETLTEYIKLATEPEAARPTGRMATLAPPRQNAARVDPAQPSGGGAPSARDTASERSSTRPAPRTPLTATRPVPSARPAPAARSRVPVVAGVVAAVALLGGGAAFVLTRREPGDEPSRGGTSTRVRTRPAPGSRCAGEPAQPDGVRATARVGEYLATCSPDGGRMMLTARVGTRLVARARAPQRGQAWADAPAPDAPSVVELGDLLAQPQADWVAWRNGIGAPIGLARIDAHGALPVPVQLPGWDNVPLRGVYLLHVSDRAVYVATNAVYEAGAIAVLLEVALTPSPRPRVVSWFLGPGTVDAVIPGDHATVLFHTHSHGAGAVTQHALTAVTVDLAAVSSTRAPADPTSSMGGHLADAVFTRSAAQTLEGPVLVAAPRGARGAAGEATFLVTVGAVRTPESCASSTRCVGPGAVSTVAFAGAAAPTLTAVAADAQGEDLLPGVGGALDALVLSEAPTAASVHKLVRVASPTGVTTLTAQGSPRARLLSCGDAPWMVYDVERPSALITALPLDCLQSH